MVSLDEIKEYLRIDSTDEDNLLNNLSEMAEKYIERTTGKKNNGDKIYTLCVLLLVSHWYENRIAVSDNQKCNIPHSLDAIINHISFCGEYE